MSAYATQVLIVSSTESKRLPLSVPRTLHEIRDIVARCILKRGGDNKRAGRVRVSLPYGTSTAIVNL